MPHYRNDPIECYTEYSLDEYGQLGEVFAEIGANSVPASTAKTAFLIYGPPGNGKSSCVGALHKVLADRKILVHWVDCAAWPTDWADRDELVEDLSSSNCHILVWDDLGKEPKQCHRDVEKVIMARYQHRRRLDLFTCNLNILPDDPQNCELTTVYGSSVRSRLFGMCGKNIVDFNGPDHRLGV